METKQLKYKITILERQVKELNAKINRINKNIYKEPVKKELFELKELKHHLCRYLDISEYLLTMKSKEREIVNYKHAFIYKAVRLQKFNYEQIGSVIGLKKMSVFHAVRNLDLRINKLPEFNKIINDIKEIEL